MKALPLPPDLLARSLPNAGADLATAFADAARAVGSEVHTTTDDDLETTLGALLAGRNPALVARLDRSHVGVPGPSPFALEATVIGAVLGIAASGSVLLEGARLPPMTAPLVIAIVRTATLVPTLRDALIARRSAPLPPSRLIVTGPSKTADIEGILVTGVHGPERFVIALVA